MTLVGAGWAASQFCAMDSRRLHMSKHKGLTSKGPPSWAKVFNRARAEKPGVCNQITESGVQFGQSQAVQEHCCGAPLPQPSLGHMWHLESIMCAQYYSRAPTHKKLHREDKQNVSPHGCVPRRVWEAETPEKAELADVPTQDVLTW